ncbi:MAG TPA: hypothetical protein VF756_03965 [Thermoanaerobaculia bacterium]
MLVYGDAKRREEAAEKIERIRAGLAGLSDLRPGIERHGALAEQLVEAGELEQALLDHQLAREGRERATSLAERTSRLTRGVAEALLLSFRHQEASPSKVASLRTALRSLRRLGLPDDLSVTVPEGYVLYGLYPETYLRAAERFRQERPRQALRVIGIRSIGTSLAAAVAAAGKAELSISLRPGGHPFARAVTLGNRLSRKLLSIYTGGRPFYAIVDEGPGFSGSSFGSVADWLEDRGVAAESIVFFPSHPGNPGRYASERHRRRWEQASRHLCSFEELFLSPGCDWPLERWFEDLTGPAEAPLEDLSAGRWQERRKYLLSAGGKRWLLKFAGLGRYGRERLELAEALQDAGFIPPVTGLRHGFLIGPWLEDARPLPLIVNVDREALLDQVGRYIAFRASRFPAEGRGTSPEKLLEMAEFNTEQALGKDAAEALRPWRERLPELSALARPVLTDNRMHAWEWLVLPDGQILKADALDHHAGNDLVGAQDPAWDLAGAIVELGLEKDRLLEAAARHGLRSAPVQLAFYTLAYLAFQIGWHTLAAQALEGMNGEEAARMRRAAERYGERLGAILPSAPGS